MTTNCVSNFEYFERISHILMMEIDNAFCISNIYMASKNLGPDVISIEMV